MRYSCDGDSLASYVSIMVATTTRSTRLRNDDYIKHDICQSCHQIWRIDLQKNVPCEFKVGTVTELMKYLSCIEWDKQSYVSLAITEMIAAGAGYSCLRGTIVRVGAKMAFQVPIIGEVGVAMTSAM